MKNWLFAIPLLWGACFLNADETQQAEKQAEKEQALENKSVVCSPANVDAKNVMAQVGNLLILRTFDSSVFGSDLNARRSHIEAYDMYTGRQVWHHQDIGVIVTFLVAGDRLILRNYDRMTALDIYTGQILWSNQTQGSYSIVAGE
jgi:outer membrane protein assembly factor BamB